jgi:hypothetical protein
VWFRDHLVPPRDPPYCVLQPTPRPCPTDTDHLLFRTSSPCFVTLCIVSTGTLLAQHMNAAEAPCPGGSTLDQTDTSLKLQKRITQNCTISTGKCEPSWPLMNVINCKRRSGYGCGIVRGTAQPSAVFCQGATPHPWCTPHVSEPIHGTLGIRSRGDLSRRSGHLDGSVTDGTQKRPR